MYFIVHAAFVRIKLMMMMIASRDLDLYTLCLRKKRAVELL